MEFFVKRRHQINFKSDIEQSIGPLARVAYIYSVMNTGVPLPPHYRSRVPQATAQDTIVATVAGAVPRIVLDITLFIRHAAKTRREIVCSRTT